MKDQPADFDSSGTYLISVDEFEGRAKTREEALLESLRELLQAPLLEWAEPPRPSGEGVESIVLDLALHNAGEWSDVPLVVRLLKNDDPGQLAREAALQGALADAGFPSPRPVAHGPGRPGILQPFLVMERVPGRVMYAQLPAFIGTWIVLVVVGLGPLGWLLGVGWYALTIQLQRRLHALPLDAIERSISDRGLDPVDFGLASWVERLRAQVERLGLHDLMPGIAWLRDNPPPTHGAVVCHGDYWPGNVMVSLRGVTGLIDWPNACFAPPEFDLSWNRVQDAGDLAGVHRLSEPWRGRLGALLQPFAWTALLPHRWLYRLFRKLDSQDLDYYTAFHCLRILIWSYDREHEAKGEPNPWSSKRARALVSRRFARITGTELAAARR